MGKVLEIVDIIVEYLSSFGLIGGFLLTYIESILPILPLDVFIALNIMSFGHFTGLVISYIGSICGCMTVFLIFKYFIKDNFRKFVNKKDMRRLNHLMEMVDHIKFNSLAVLIAIPFTPAFLVNIAAGLSNIDRRKYFLALLLGKPVMIYFCGYIGMNIFECFRNPLVLIKIFVVVGITYLVSKMIGRIFKVEV